MNGEVVDLVRSFQGIKPSITGSTKIERNPGALRNGAPLKTTRNHGNRVRFFSTVELVNALELEKTQRKSGQMAGSLHQSQPPPD